MPLNESLDKSIERFREYQNKLLEKVANLFSQPREKMINQLFKPITGTFSVNNPAVSKTIEPAPMLTTVTRSGGYLPERLMPLPMIEDAAFARIPIAAMKTPI